MTNIMAAAALIASQIGAPLPQGVPAVEAPVAISAPALAAPAANVSVISSYVSASGNLSGNGYLHCSAPQNGSGWMSGSINLSAQMLVNGPDGARGTIPVSGYAYLTGSCQNGAGFVSGSVSVTGYGTLYSREGNRAGTVSLNGSVFVSQYASGFVWINQYATVSGYFTSASSN